MFDENYEEGEGDEDRVEGFGAGEEDDEAVVLALKLVATVQFVLVDAFWGCGVVWWLVWCGGWCGVVVGVVWWLVWCGGWCVGLCLVWWLVWCGGWCGVVWCGVVWCGGWCGVVW